MNSDILYQGNSTITLETHPDYLHPVVVKKHAKRHPSQNSLRTLENEYQMTSALKTVDGVRKALEQQSVDNQAVLMLEYIEGGTLQDTIRKTIITRNKICIFFNGFSFNSFMMKTILTVFIKVL